MAGSWPTICCRSTAAGKSCACAASSRSRLATRGNRAWQSFFVNNRYIKSRLLSAALEEAYRNQIMVGRFPACVLEIDMPVQAVDVNVHPAKTEVKFLSEREVFDAVHYAVLSTLSRAAGRPEWKTPEKKQEAAPQPQSQPKAVPAAEARLLSDHAGIRIPPSGCAAACAEAGPARAGLAGAAAALRACACAAELSTSEAGSKAGGQTGAEARTED